MIRVDIMDIESSIDTLHERTQKLRLDISTHEAVCEERYTQLLKTLEKMDLRLDIMQREVKDLREMAITGKISLKTLLWVGSATGGAVALVLSILKVIKV
jgi:SMC interacting uncharacterized protein involved in chromosome segregation